MSSVSVRVNESRQDHLLVERDAFALWMVAEERVPVSDCDNAVASHHDSARIDDSSVIVYCVHSAPYQDSKRALVGPLPSLCIEPSDSG